MALDIRLRRQGQQEAGGLRTALPNALAALNKGSFHPQPGLSGPAQEVALTSPFLTSQLCAAVGEQPQSRLWDSPVSHSPHSHTPTLLPLLEVTAERRPEFPASAWLLGLGPWHTTNPLRTQVPQESTLSSLFLRTNMD